MITPYQHSSWENIPYTARPFTQRSYSKYPYVPRSVNRPEEDKGYILDYNDPYEVNSYIDVFFNQAALDKVYPRKHDNGRFDVADIPEIVWQRLKAHYTFPYRAIGKPLLNTKDGKWKPDMAAVGLNFLTGFGETMDVLANPIKGMLLEKEGPLKGLAKGLGVSKDGRKNYDFDFNTGTGVTDFLANIAAEILVDPFNWVTFGTAMAVKSAAKGGASVIADAAMKTAKSFGQEISQESAERFAKTVMKQVYKSSSDDIAQSISKGVKRAAHKRWFDTAADSMNINFINKFIENTADIGADQLAMHTIRSVQKFGETFDQIERGLMLASTYGTFKAAGALLKRGAVRPIRAFISSHIDKAYENFRRADGIIPLNKLDAATEAAKDSMRFKIIDVSDVAETSDQIKVMQLNEIQKQTERAEKFLLSNKNPMEDLARADEYFRKVSDGAFDTQGYIAYLEKFAEKYPHLRGHYTILNAKYNYLKLRIALKDQEDLIKFIFNLQKQTDKLEDLLINENVLKDTRAVLDELAYIRQNLKILKGANDAPAIDNILRTVDNVEESLNALIVEQDIIQASYNKFAKTKPIIDLEELWDSKLKHIKVPKKFTAKQKLAVEEFRQLIVGLDFRSHLNLTPQDILAVNIQFKKLKKYAPKDKQVRALFKDFFSEDGTAEGLKNYIKKLQTRSEQNKPLTEKFMKAHNSAITKLEDIRLEKIKDVKAKVHDALDNIQKFNEDARNTMDTYQNYFETHAKAQTISNKTYMKPGEENTLGSAMEELYTQLYTNQDEKIDAIIQKLGIVEDVKVTPTATLVEDIVPFIGKKSTDAITEGKRISYADFIVKLTKANEELFTLEDIGIDDITHKITEQVYAESFGEATLKNILFDLRETFREILNATEQSINPSDGVKKSFEELASIKNLRKYSSKEGFKKEIVDAASDHLTTLKEFIENNPVVDHYNILEDLTLIDRATIKHATASTPYEYIKDRIVYQLKLAQAETAVALLNIPSIKTFCKNVMGDGEYATTLKKLLNHEDVGEYAKELQAFAYDFIVYSDLVNTIMKMDDTLGDLKYNLFDTLQSPQFKTRKFRNILGRRESYINEIINETQKQITSIDARKKYSLDALFGVNPKTGAEGPYKKDFEEWYKAKNLGKIEQHDAATDKWQTVYLIEKDPRLQTIRDSLDFDNNIYIVADTETTGLEVGDQMRQLSYVALNDPTIQGDIHMKTPGFYPSQDVLDMSFEGSKELYAAKYHDKALPDTGQGVKEFFTTLSDLQQTTGKTVVLIGQNADDFDWPRIHRIARSSNNNIPIGLYKSFQRMKTIDTLLAMQAGDNIAMLTIEQRQAIKDVLTGYIEVKASNPYMEIFNAQFIRTADRDFLISTADFAKKINDLTLMGNRVDRPALPITDAELFNLNKNLYAMREDTLLTLGNIKETNKALKNIQITYDKTTGIITNADGVRLDFGEGVLQPMHVFVNKSGELMPFAIKRIEKTEPTIRKFFGKLSGKFKLSEQQSLYRFSADASKIAKAVRKVGVVTELYDYYADIGRQAKEVLTAWYLEKGLTLPAALRLFDPEIVGTLDRFAATYKFISSMHAFAANHSLTEYYETFITKLITHKDAQYDAAIRTLLNRDSVFDYNVYKKFTGETFDVGPFDLNATELYSDNASLRTEAQGYLSTIDELQTHLSLIKNKHSAEYAMTQMQFSVLENFRQYWQTIEDYLHTADETGIEALKNVQIIWGMEKTFAQLDWFAKMPVQDLKDYLWLAMGRVTFATPEIISDNAASRMSVIYKQLIDRADELKAAGISIRYDESYSRMWVYLDYDPEFVKQKLKFDKDWRRQNYLHPNKRIDPYAKFYVTHTPMLPVDGMPADILKAMESAEETLSTLTHGKSQGTLGDIMYDTIFEDMDRLAPPDIRKNFIPISMFKDNGYFENSLIFNRSNIGLVKSRRDITKKISGIPFKNYMNAAQILVPMLDSRVKAKYLFFDEINNLNGPMYKELSDLEIFEMLKKEPQLRLAALVKDPKMGARVQEFYVGSVKDITRLRGQLDIAMLPSGTLLQAYKHINYMEISNPVLRFYKKYVVGGLKAGYLSSIGFVIRNIVDSTLKNLILTEDPSESWHMLRHMLETAKLVSAYNDIYKEMTQYTDDVITQAPQFYSKRVLDRMYKVDPNRKITKEAFQEVHNFMQHGPSAGISKHQIEINKIKDKKYREVLELPTQHDIVSKLMWENPWTNFIMDKNGTFEQIARLAGYTWELQNGATIDEAMEKILKTHFDYSMKSKAMMYLEYVVPFASFFINNTAYWMEILDQFGWVAGLFTDITKPIFNLDEYSAEELNQNRSLQYNILAGNVVFDDNLTVKLNPSILDAINALIDPGEALSRTVPWVKLPLEYLYNRIQNEDVLVNNKKLVLTNLPLIGPMVQKVWTAPEDEPWDAGAIQKVYQRTGKRFASYVPSIFGAVQRNYYFTYPGSDMVYMTHGEEKYLEHINKGALPIAGKIREFAEDYFIRKKKVYKKYTRKYYSKRYYAPKKPRKVWTAGLSAADYYAGARVKATVRGTQLRMPAANSTLRSVKPALVRRLYTGSGRSRFSSRLVPVTSRNLAAKLRSDWRVLS